MVNTVSVPTSIEFLYSLSFTSVSQKTLYPFVSSERLEFHLIDAELLVALVTAIPWTGKGFAVVSAEVSQGITLTYVLTLSPLPVGFWIGWYGPVEEPQKLFMAISMYELSRFVNAFSFFIKLQLYISKRLALAT